MHYQWYKILLKNYGDSLKNSFNMNSIRNRLLFGYEMTKLNEHTTEIKFPVHIIITDEPMMITDEFGETTDLKDEGGSYSNHIIYIFKDKFIEMLGTGVHETVEEFLVTRLKVPFRIAHTAANIIQQILTLGMSTSNWFTLKELYYLNKYKAKSIVDLPNEILIKKGLIDLKKLNGYAESTLKEIYNRIKDVYPSDELTRKLKEFLNM